MRWWAAIAVPAITLGCAGGGVLSAQAPAELDRLEASIDAGSFEGVRAELDSWITSGSQASPEDLGRARFLRARLRSDADSARIEFLTVALEGRSSYASRAWLRLAQLDLSRGQMARAVEDLERLRADYPRSASTAASWYWTGRALESGGQLTEACAAFDRALNEASAVGDAVTGGSASERRRVCGEGGLKFTLQIGAFSGDSAAESLASTARALGLPVRVVVDENLRKVRVGLFGSADAARLLEARLRAGGFTVAVVAVES